MEMWGKSRLRRFYDTFLLNSRLYRIALVYDLKRLGTAKFDLILY